MGGGRPALGPASPPLSFVSWAGPSLSKPQRPPPQNGHDSIPSPSRGQGSRWHWQQGSGCLAQGFRQASAHSINPTKPHLPEVPGWPGLPGGGPSRADQHFHLQAQRGAGLAAAVALHRPLPAWQGAAAPRPEIHRHAEKEGAGPRLQPPHPEGPEVSLTAPRPPGMSAWGCRGAPQVLQELMVQCGHLPVEPDSASFLEAGVSLWRRDQVPAAGEEDGE